ncbi:hypothetical protein F4808DRAFT_41892 [Astrocystis sublimbata]|nr:hypothetical protein F4808DRAFT_41892 [Astrocystis sublimbata]
MGTHENTHENMSSDSSSSLFPDRPIRPLPKRRLRERISPDIAGSIKYPPAPQACTPLFVYPYNPREDPSSFGSDLVGVGSRDHEVKPDGDPALRRNALVGHRNEGSILTQARRALGSLGFHEGAEQAASRVPTRSAQARQPKPQPPPSTDSSADRYDSFENTNNKKKRKIPIAGETILNGTHVLNEPATFGMPSPPDTADDDCCDHVPTSTPYYQSGGSLSNGQGLSGPGRGRLLSRSRNGRSPLRPLADSNANNANWPGQNMKVRTAGQYPSPPAEHSGIISTAIASAERIPIPSGQENISLLQQQFPPKPTSRSSPQFTFTFGSQNPVSWPGSNPAPHKMGASEPRRAQHVSGATEYHAGAVRNAHSQPVPPAGPASTSTNTSPPGEGSGQKVPNVAGTARKPRSKVNPLLQAASRRRKETEIQNFHHPPAPENKWICEFCEYETIFGEPPKALIQQYEIKDRRRRREEAERRRLLEKAKMKSRKGKKVNNNKAPVRNNSVTDRSASLPNEPQHHASGGGRPPDDGGETFDSEDNYDENLAQEGEGPASILDPTGASTSSQGRSSIQPNPRSTSPRSHG